MGEKDLGRMWNDWMEPMIKAREGWEALQEELLETPRTEVEGYPVDVQRVVALWRRMDFTTMLSNFAFHAPTSGGLEEFLVLTKKERRRMEAELRAATRELEKQRDRALQAEVTETEELKEASHG